MLKLVVLSLLIAISMAAPAPGLLHAPITYAIPTAVSHQSRVDIHNTPVLATSYSVASPVGLGHHVPLIHSLPAAVSHAARVDLHRNAVIAGPVIGHGYGIEYAASVPTIHGW